MTDAPLCPNQNQVGPSVARFLKPLQIAGVAGVQVYGRRAGQKRPLWSYGVDFVSSRNRLVPEATPDFAASDAYVDDLLAPPGALVLYRDLPSNDWRSILTRWLERAIEQIQRSLIRSQLFIPSELEDLEPSLTVGSDSLANQTNGRNAKVALVWGTVGLLLVIQSEWLLGQVLQPPLLSSKPASLKPSPSPSAESPAPSARVSSSPTLPQLSLQKSKPKDENAFNSTGFTQPSAGNSTAASINKDPSASEGDTDSSSANLPASPLQSKADLVAVKSANPFPTFNSRQLDEKVALYHRYLTEHGPLTY